MKYLAFILLVISLALIPTRTFSWDTEIAKFMPLQVGNLWIYYSYNQTFPMHGTGYTKYTVTGLIESSGKKYYQIQQSYHHISGVPPGCGIPFFYDLRIDSVTMNLYQKGGGCNSADRLIDSLFSGKNDTSWICMPIQFSHCTDTNAVNIFSSTRSVKKFNNSGRGNSTAYAKGIGILGWGFAELNTLCVDTLKGCVINGVVYGDTSTLVGINQISVQVPSQFVLSQNYPNPFNPVTSFGFQIADFGLVRLTVFDAIGREVEVLVNQQLQPGTYEVGWDASVHPSGVYYYRLESGRFTETKKMVLIK